jgi:homoserine dehydrogenase
MKEIGIGLLGLGHVGSGVVRAIERNGALIADRTGFRLIIRRIAVRDVGKVRPVKVDSALLTQDAASVIEDPNVHVVVEMIGGTTDAHALTLQALQAGKPVVTANKALLAERGDEIFAKAERRHVDLYFGPSVGGGIPIIRGLREDLIGNHIVAMYGILNGTCNYILTRMEQEHLPIETVLAEAQAAGYAEAEPSLDIDGWDTAHKAVILASTAYGFFVPMEDVDVRGIRDVALADIKEARAMGFAMKLLAVIQHLDDGISIRVQPTLVPDDNLLASVGGVFNAVLVVGDIVGEALFYGRGAGPDPTASAVLADLVDVGRNLIAGSENRVPALARHHQYGGTRCPDDIPGRCYLRLLLRDEPGVLALVAEICAAHKISIASVRQYERGSDGHATVIIVTHSALERQFNAAIAVIDGLDTIAAPVVQYRIEDFQHD